MPVKLSWAIRTMPDRSANRGRLQRNAHMPHSTVRAELHDVDVSRGLKRCRGRPVYRWIPTIQQRCNLEYDILDRAQAHVV